MLQLTYSYTLNKVDASCVLGVFPVGTLCSMCVLKWNGSVLFECSAMSSKDFLSKFKVAEHRTEQVFHLRMHGVLSVFHLRTHGDHPPINRPALQICKFCPPTYK